MHLKKIDRQKQKKLFLPCVFGSIMVLLCLSLLPQSITPVFAKSKSQKVSNYAGLDPVYSPDGKYITYVHRKDDGSEGYLYRKKNKIKDKSRGKVINSFKSASPVYSPDGKYIVYVNLERGNKLYRKNADDNSDGEDINKSKSSDPAYSPDGRYIVYSNNDEDGKLYRKDLTEDDNGDGEQITDVNSQNPAYSPDGKYIYYLNVNDSKIYRRDADDDDDDENGEALKDIKAYSFAISPSGKYITYSSTAKKGLLYYRKTGGSGKGKSINKYTSNEPSYSPKGSKVIFANADKKMVLFSTKIK